MPDPRFCDIRSVTLSSKSMVAVREIEGVISQGNLFTITLAAIPLFDLFFGRNKPVERLNDIANYDFVEFSNIAQASGRITRRKILHIAEPLSWSAPHNEKEFWKCLTNAVMD